MRTRFTSNQYDQLRRVTDWRWTHFLMLFILLNLGSMTTSKRSFSEWKLHWYCGCESQRRANTCYLLTATSSKRSNSNCYLVLAIINVSVFEKQNMIGMRTFLRNTDIVTLIMEERESLEVRLLTTTHFLICQNITSASICSNAYDAQKSMSFWQIAPRRTAQKCAIKIERLLQCALTQTAHTLSKHFAFVSDGRPRRQNATHPVALM